MKTLIILCGFLMTLGETWAEGTISGAADALNIPTGSELVFKYDIVLPASSKFVHLTQNYKKSESDDFHYYNGPTPRRTECYLNLKNDFVENHQSLRIPAGTRITITESHRGVNGSRVAHYQWAAVFRLESTTIHSLICSLNMGAVEDRFHPTISDVSRSLRWSGIDIVLPDPQVYKN